MPWPVLLQRAERERLRDTYIANLFWAANRARTEGVEVLIEPIAQRNMPGFFLNRQDEAHDLVAETGAPNLKILMDLSIARFPRATCDEDAQVC